MAYTLEYGRGIAVSEQVKIDPSPEDIERVINELLPTIDHYAVLTADMPVNNFEYIQTAIHDNGDAPEIEFLVEARKKTNDGFVQYQTHIKDINEVKRLFRMFALERPPDITDWVDVTEEIKSLPSVDEQRKKLRKKAERLTHKK